MGTKGGEVLEFSHPLVGWVRIEGTAKGVARLSFGDAPSKRDQAASTDVSGLLEDARRQLVEYFDGVRKSFEVDIDLTGVTPFQAKVYDVLVQVPHGSIVSYSALADLAEFPPEATRAVAGAMAANRVPVLIPCHRVVRVDSRLGGFSGGLHRKVALLRLEGVDVGGVADRATVSAETLSLPFA